MDRVKISVVTSSLMREMGLIGQAQGIFQGSEIILYDTLMVERWNYAFVKMHRTIKYRVNPKVNYRL